MAIEDVLKEALINKLNCVGWTENTEYGVWDAIYEVIESIDFNEDYDEMKKDRDRYYKDRTILQEQNLKLENKNKNMRCCGNCNSWETNDCMYHGGLGFFCNDWIPIIKKSEVRIAFEQTDHFKNAVNDHQRSDRWQLFEAGYNARENKNEH